MRIFQQIEAFWPSVELLTRSCPGFAFVIITRTRTLSIVSIDKDYFILVDSDGVSIDGAYETVSDELQRRESIC